MRKPLFLRIVDELTTANSFFKQRRNAAGAKGFSPIHKCTAAMRVLAYGQAADAVDDVLMMGESTVLKCVKVFVKTVISVYQEEYLRSPRQHEIEEMMRSNVARGFPGIRTTAQC